jgi:hypothetical protein
MAFTGNAMCTSFKVELLKGVHNFSTGGNTFKLALYTATATLERNDHCVQRDERSRRTLARTLLAVAL